jgi:hypothetical protein
MTRACARSARGAWNRQRTQGEHLDRNVIETYLRRDTLTMPGIEQGDFI